MTGGGAEAPGRSGLARLHSLCGVVPAGGFLLLHFWENGAAARGADAYNAAAHRLQGLPLAALLEIFLIAFPLGFHGVYGLFLMAYAPPEPDRPGGRPLGWVQRGTGVVVFAFLLFHYWTTRLVQLHDHESLDLFRQVQAALANPWIRAFYVAGILSAAFHFSAGLWSFAASRRVAPSRAARRFMAGVCAALFLALSAAALRSLSAFRL